MEPFITTFYSTRGGVGTTSLAVNTAAALQREFGQPVLLFDAKAVPRGDIRVILGMKEGRTLTDILPLVDKAPGTVLSGYIPEKWEGMAVLNLFGDFADRGRVTPANMRDVLAKIAGCFPFIVIDAGSSFDGFVQIVLELSDCVVLPVIPDVPSLEQARQLLSFLQYEKYTGAKIEIVLNRTSKREALRAERVAEVLERPVRVELPEDGDGYKKMIESGVPVVLADARGAFAQSISKLVRILEDRRTACKPNPGRWTAAVGVQDAHAPAAARHDGAAAARAVADDLLDIKQRVHKRLVLEMEFSNISSSSHDPESEQRFIELTRQTVTRLLDEEAPQVSSRAERDRLIHEIVDEAVGLGPLEGLLSDDDVNEIMVNHARQIYVEKRSGKGSKMILTGNYFPTDKHLLAAIDRIVSRVGRRVDERSPMVDARLADGSRVNAIIPPVAIQGPMLTIRKFSRKKLTADDLVAFGSISTQIAAFMDACVCTRRNIVISGGTGSGKTTLLNIISNFIPDDERILTIEDSAELRLQKEHLGRLEARPPNIEGQGEITIRDLVKNALRMRPDRIVVGECRGGEALDMLQAMNTGHDGSMTTVHANSPRDAIARLTTLVLMAGMDLPERAIVQQIASAVHVIIQIARLADGSRKVTSVTEVAGMEGAVVTLQEIFRFAQTGVTPDGKVKGDFLPTGNVPTFFDAFALRGIRLNREIFQATG